MLRRYWRVWGVLAAIGSLMIRWEICSAQPVAEAPIFKVGDTWEFQKTIKRTNQRGQEDQKWTRRIAEIGPADRLQVMHGSSSLEQHDRAMNLIPEGKPEHLRLLIRYPLQVGSQWSYKRKLENPMLEERGRAKVAGFESVTVPAGTFDCYRIEVKAESSHRTIHTLSSWIHWVCPELKWIAKMRHETRTYSAGAGGETDTVEIDELVKFTPGP